MSVCECPKRAPVLLVNKYTGEAFQPQCKKYACPVCGKIKVGRLRKAVVNAFKDATVRLMTLTTTNRFNARIGKDLCEETWKEFSRLIRKSSKVGYKATKLRYVRLKERHKNGAIHYHLIIDQYLSLKTFQGLWDEAARYVLAKHAIFPPANQGIARLDLEGPPAGATHNDAGRYVTKYVTKYADSEAYAIQAYDAGFVRYRPYATSRNVHLFEKKVSTGAWGVFKWHLLDSYQKLYLSPNGLIPQDFFRFEGISVSPEGLVYLFPELYGDGVAPEPY